MKTLKYSTDNLTCYYVKENNTYQIFEGDKLICIYIDSNNMKLANKLPENIFNYKYVDELKEIILFINKEEN